MRKMARGLKILGIVGVLVQASCMQLEYVEMEEPAPDLKPQVSRHREAYTGLSYYDAILLCNKMSLAEGLDTLYQHDKPVFVEDSLFWLPNIKLLENRQGYRLPTKEEWIEAKENGEIEDLDENTGEWLYREANSEYSTFELAPSFLKAIGFYREKEGYPVYGVRVVRVEL